MAMKIRGLVTYRRKFPSFGDDRIILSWVADGNGKVSADWKYALRDEASIVDHKSLIS